MTLPTHSCLRCDHTWIPRREGLPAKCPKCMSVYWNESRQTKPKAAAGGLT
jgi:predicted Zn-ribbon and HTH transcriptional regulator